MSLRLFLAILVSGAAIFWGVAWWSVSHNQDMTPLLVLLFGAAMAVYLAARAIMRRDR